MKKAYQTFWDDTAGFILKHKLWLMLVILVLTVFMAFKATTLKLSYELPKILPKSDEHFIVYEKFKKTYGEDGNVMILAIKTDQMFALPFFSAWYQLNTEIKGLKGIKNVLSLASLSVIRKNDVSKKFESNILFKKPPTTQEEVNSLKMKLDSLPFFDGLLYNGDAHLMAVTFDQSVLNSKERIDISQRIQKIGEDFGEQNKVKVHYSGMPFIRTNFMSKVRDELILFMGLALIITAGILYLFFRSFKSVSLALGIVLIGVIWSVGLMALFGFNISILTGLIPPLIIVIGIPNTIFLINKYQEEYIRTNDKISSLKTTISRIGKTTFLANVTTFIGFFVFYFTQSPLLVEFGLVASICVMATWLISLIMIPALFTYMDAPQKKQVKHLDNKYIKGLLEKIVYIVKHKRSLTYVVVLTLLVLSIAGVFGIKAIGYVVDDLPKNDPIYTDLKFVEENFKGVIPIEVNVDTKTSNGIFDAEILNKIKATQKLFAKNPEFTKPLSVVEGIKYLYQVYRGGDPKYFVLPPALELQKMASYLNQNESSMFSSFFNKDKSSTRISFQSADVGTVEYDRLYRSLKPKLDSIFTNEEGKKTQVQLTGNGVVFTKGNDYLLRNLRESTLLAILLVCLVMATQFLDYKTILVSTIPSIIPLIITAGIMGYFNIPLKPSTILIFSISFGIASDGTIYFLTKYKDELKANKSVLEAVTETIRLTGISMVYTAFILFFGFGIFVASGFKGTFFLGLLVSITLMIGMISNLILLPCLLLTIDSRKK